jgi:hypothetical protein
MSGKIIPLRAGRATNRKIVDLTQRRERIEASATLAEMSLARARTLAGLVRSEIEFIAEIVSVSGTGASAPLYAIDLAHLDLALVDALADLELLRLRLAAGEDTKGKT